MAVKGGEDRNKTVRYLLENIDSLKKAGSVGGGKGEGKGVTYELYCRDSGERTSASGELADIAKRLSTLETAVGAAELKSGVCSYICEP